MVSFDIAGKRVVIMAGVQGSAMSSLESSCPRRLS